MATRSSYSMDNAKLSSIDSVQSSFCHSGACDWFNHEQQSEKVRSFHRSVFDRLTLSSSDFIPTTMTTNAENDVLLVPEVDTEEILRQVEAVIPDIDMDAARRSITAMNPIPSVDDIVSQFLDNGYTKRVKRSSTTMNENQRGLSLKRSLSDILDDIPKFLNSYPDPITYFFDTQRKQSESYVNHSKAYLLRAFPNLDKTVLDKALEEEKFHFLPTVRKLETQLGLKTNAFLQRSTIRKSLEMLGNDDAFFPSLSDRIALHRFRSFHRWRRSNAIDSVVDEE